MRNCETFCYWKWLKAKH